jgi:hypothetical protein
MTAISAITAISATGAGWWPRRAEAQGAHRAQRKGLNGNELFTLEPSVLAETVEAYRALGVRWVRFDFNWSAIARAGREAFDVARFEKVVQALQAARIDVLGLIAYTPAWANAGQSKFHPPTSAADFAQFAGRLARHFSAGGVHAWEIWNEPNMGQFWAPRADAAAYVALLKRAYVAIHEADAKAIVVSGGLAQPYPSANDIDALQFARALCAASARERCFDALGNHPYDSPRLPSERAAHNWQKMIGTGPASLRGMLTEHGLRETPIWITEFGAATSGVDSYGTVVSEERQAHIVEDAFRLVSGYPWSGPLFWYNFKDFCPPGPTQSSECFYGLLRLDGTYKPAARKYAAFAREEMTR